MAPREQEQEEAGGRAEGGSFRDVELASMEAGEKARDTRGSFTDAGVEGSEGGSEGSEGGEKPAEGVSSSGAAARERHHCAEDDEDAECRFCFEPGTQDDPLVVPCNCKGTIAWVHKSCLRKWVLEKVPQNLTCEICHEPFQLANGESVLSAEELLAFRHAFELQQRLSQRHGGGHGDEDGRFGGHGDGGASNLRAFLMRHERLSRWINACILFAFSVIMLLVIVFLIYNWNTYYKNRENVVLLDDVQPFDSGIEVFTGFCRQPESRMLCIVSQETLQNTTQLQQRLCYPGLEDQGKACLRYSTYSIHMGCEVESADCSLLVLPGVQDGVCDDMGTCDKVSAEASQELMHTFESHFIRGTCACR